MEELGARGEAAAAAGEVQPLVEAFSRWCDEETLKVLDETPISEAIGDARNQREALCRFLGDGRLPIQKNISENALRRQAAGRKNWLLLGTDEGGEVNATLVALLASCGTRPGLLGNDARSPRRAATA